MSMIDSVSSLIPNSAITRFPVKPQNPFSMLSKIVSVSTSSVLTLESILLYNVLQNSSSSFTLLEYLLNVE